MSVTVFVGIEQELINRGEVESAKAYRSALDELSADLAAYRVSWREPGPTELPRNRARSHSFGLRMVHYLRRAAVVVRAGEPVKPMPRGESQDAEPEDEEKYELPSSHLLYHSDCDGYYIPVDFAEPIALDYEIVGSTQRLLAELLQCAPALGIACQEDGSLSDDEAERIAYGAFRSPFQFEWTVWLALHEACLQSIATGHAIVLR